MDLFIQQLWDNPRFFFAVIVTVVISICLHELAHGLVAIAHGDRTPIEQGRLSPNPLVHMGMMSIIVLLISGIAWGSMPIDRSRLRGRYAEALVALAGPFTNVLLSVITLAILGLWQRFQSGGGFYSTPAGENLRYLLLIAGVVNLQLAMFNLIPIPPLDGAHVLSNLSQAYNNLMRSIAMSGGAIVPFILVFSFAGKIIGPAAERGGMAILAFMRGY